MGDLSFTQGADPVAVVNDSSGNQLVISATGAASVDASATTSLPLPTGAATSSLQTTANTSLASIDAGIPAALGQATMANSMPVVIASNQSSIPVTTEGAKATYSAGFAGIVIAAAATDVFTIVGSATKTLRITRLACSVTTTAGSGIALNATLVKRSTADTAGTSTTATLVPLDSTNPAATTTVRSYTANPTLGTTVGIIRSNRFQVSTAGATENELVWDFGVRPAQSVVLRGATEQLCLNFGGATITGPLGAFSVEWTEE